MADIFISYARDGVERVRPIAEPLKADGWGVRWDIESTRVDQEFSEAIENAIEHVQVDVVAFEAAMLAYTHDAILGPKILFIHPIIEKAGCFRILAGGYVP